MKTQKFSTKQLIAAGTLGVMTLGGIATTATPAQADAKTWKKATIGAGAVTAYGLLKHNGKATTLGAIGTVGSYLMYKKSKKKEDAREAQRQQWYRNRYGRNWRSHYVPGRG